MCILLVKILLVWMTATVVCIKATCIVITLRAGYTVIAAFYKYFMACLRAVANNGLEKCGSPAYYVQLYIRYC